MPPARPQRVIAYVDGFNLYFGLRDSGLRRCYWLNVRALAESLLRPNQQLVATKYFTARIAGGRVEDPPERARLLDAKGEGGYLVAAQGESDQRKRGNSSPRRNAKADVSGAV